MKIISIKDTKANIFLQPNFQGTIPDAVRTFKMLLTNDNLVSRFPNDYRLYQLGEFDSNTGKFEIFQTPNDLGSAEDHMEKPKQPSLPTLQAATQ